MSNITYKRIYKHNGGLVFFNITDVEELGQPAIYISENDFDSIRLLSLFNDITNFNLLVDSYKNCANDEFLKFEVSANYEFALTDLLYPFSYKDGFQSGTIFDSSEDDMYEFFNMGCMNVVTLSN